MVIPYVRHPQMLFRMIRQYTVILIGELWWLLQSSSGGGASEGAALTAVIS